MKTAPFVLSLALLGMPVAVLAQAAPPAPGGVMPFSAERMQAMQAMRQLHQQTRLAMLNALTPANRNLLATVVGQLAISPNPDFAAAASLLDASLSPNEKNAILSAEQNLHTQMRTLHEQMRAQSGEAPEQGSRVYTPSDHMRSAMTAGHVLLMMTQPLGAFMGAHMEHGLMGGPPSAIR